MLLEQIIRVSDSEACALLGVSLLPIPGILFGTHKVDENDRILITIKTSNKIFFLNKIKIK